MCDLQKTQKIIMKRQSDSKKKSEPDSDSDSDSEPIIEPPLSISNPYQDDEDSVQSTKKQKFDEPTIPNLITLCDPDQYLESNSKEDSNQPHDDRKVDDEPIIQKPLTLPNPNEDSDLS